MKTIQEKQQGFTLIELMIVVAIIGILASISIPAYKDYMIKARWAKTIHGVRALKLAVENCLSDTNAAFNLCDDLTEIKIGGYGVTQYSAGNGEYLSIDIIATTATIRITGDAPLAGCVLSVSPSFNASTGMITWGYYMASGSSLADASKCASYVKAAVTS